MTAWFILGTMFFIVTLWLLWGTSFDDYYGINKVGEYHTPVWALLIIYVVYIAPIFGIFAFLLFCILFSMYYNRKPSNIDFPKNSKRAKSQPKNIPNGRLAATDQNPTIILNFTIILIYKYQDNCRAILYIENSSKQ